MNESLKKIKVMDKKGTGKEVEITRYVIDAKERPTGVILGKLIPWTGPGGHGRLIKLAEEKFGHGNYVIASPARKAHDMDVDIFTATQRREIIEKAVPGVKYFELTGGVPAYMFRELVEKGIKRPCFIVGPDRATEFKKFFVEYDRNNRSVEDPDDKDFGKGEYIFDTTRGDDETSGTKVREYLLNDEKDAFLKATKYKPAMWSFMRDMLKKNHLVKENTSTSFKEFYLLSEGGNVVVKGIPASKINVSKMTSDEFDELKEILHTGLGEMNKIFKRQHKEFLWPDFEKVFKNGELFSGSTKHMFSKPYDEFTKYKKTVGDIDLQFPKEKADDLLEFLRTNEGKKFGQLAYIGNGGRSHVQINTIFQSPQKFNELAKYMQVDFEPTDWESGLPTKFSGFGHHSSWKDIKENIKGAWRTNIWRSLVSRVRMGDIVVLTKTGKIASGANFKNPGKYGLSVDKGLRVKFAPVINDKGEIKLTNGKPTYTETTTADENYEKRLEKIFEFAFQRVPTDQEVEDMYSYISVLDLMKKYLNNEEVKEVFQLFMRTAFGDQGQVLEKGELVDGINQNDANVKLAAIDKFYHVFPYVKLSDKELKKMQQEFYAKKGARTDD